MKLTDKERIKKFASCFEMTVISFTDPKYICEKALRLGAVESLNLQFGESRITGIPQVCVDLNFELDASGKCIALSTSHRDSLFERKTK